MVMEQKNGTCPRTGAEVSFELQYNDNDGVIEYIDCSCSEMICCPDFDDEECPKIWTDFFNSLFSTSVEPEAAPGTNSEPLPQEESPAQPEEEEPPSES